MRLDICTEEIFPPELVDLEWRTVPAQAVRLKKDQICDTMVGFLRSICKKSFFKTNRLGDIKPGRRILLTMPVNLFFEQYVFTCYMQILSFIQD